MTELDPLHAQLISIGFREPYPGVYVNRQGQVLRRSDRLGEWNSPGRLYNRVQFTVAGKRYERKTHEVVLEAFVGRRPPGTECRHLNGQSHDNRLENLAWGTPKENGTDRISHGRSGQGTAKGRAVLTFADIIECRSRRIAGETWTRMASDKGVARSTIMRAVTGQRWTSAYESGLLPEPLVCPQSRLTQTETPANKGQ